MDGVVFRQRKGHDPDSRGDENKGDNSSRVGNRVALVRAQSQPHWKGKRSMSDSVCCCRCGDYGVTPPSFQIRAKKIRKCC